MLDTPVGMLTDAVLYLQIHFLGTLFLIGYNFIGTVLRALGDSKTPMLLVLLAAILNTIISPLFISVFDWGIKGAAYATVLAQGVAFLLGIIHTLRFNLVPFSVPFIPKKGEVFLILKLGIPSGLQMTVIFAGVTAIMTVVNSFGGTVVAGFGAAQKIDSLITLPAMELGTAVNSMAAQNIGAHRWDRVRRIAVFCSIYNFMSMISIAFFVFFFAEQLIRLFIRQEAAVLFGTEYLKIIAFFYLFIGQNFIFNGIVRGAGTMYHVLLLNILSLWVLRYPLILICAHFFHETGIAIGMGLSFVLSSIFSFTYFK